MSVIYFDIATIPDFELGTRLYNLHDLSQEDVSRVMVTKSRENHSNPGVIGQHMLQIVALSILVQDNKGIKCWSEGVPESTEANLLQTLQELIVGHQASIVTWNGNRSIFPILNYRYLSHGLHSADLVNHVDLATELSGTTGQNPLPLHDVAVLCGFPGNKAMSFDDVLDAYLEGNVELVRNGLELNIINTWLLNMRWQLVSGNIDDSSLDLEYQQFKEALMQQNKTHLTTFVESLN